MIGVAEIKYFQHSSEGIEIFLTIGNVVKELTLKKIRAASCFGLITDEMKDVSVVKFMVKSLVDFFFYLIQYSQEKKFNSQLGSNFVSAWGMRIPNFQSWVFVRIKLGIPLPKKARLIIPNEYFPNLTQNQGFKNMKLGVTGVKLLPLWDYFGQTSPK